MSRLFSMCSPISIFHPLCLLCTKGWPLQTVPPKRSSFWLNLVNGKHQQKFGEWEIKRTRVYSQSFGRPHFGSGGISLFTVTAFFRHPLPNYSSDWFPSPAPSSLVSHCYQSLCALPLLVGSLNPSHTSVNCPFIELFLPSWSVSSLLLQEAINQPAELTLSRHIIPVPAPETLTVP